MRLIDLHPRWLSVNARRHGMGMTFRCPHCDLHLVVWFTNPVDGGPPINHELYTGRLWARSGEFDDMTLFPTIHVADHWRGFVHRGVLNEQT
jgi:hypothetical protein